MQWESRLCEFLSELLACNYLDMFVSVSNSSRFCVIIVHICPLSKLGFDFFNCTGGRSYVPLIRLQNEWTSVVATFEHSSICLTTPICCGLCGVLIHTYHCKINAVCGRRMAWPMFASQTEHTGHVCIILGAATIACRPTGHVSVVLVAAAKYTN